MAGQGHERHEEQIARCLVRDVEPHLREHLGMAMLDGDFLAELYMRVLEELRSRPPKEEELMSSLALTVYIVAASQQPGGLISPDLIPHLRKVIARTFGSTRSVGSVEPISGQEEGSEHDG